MFTISWSLLMIDLTILITLRFRVIYVLHNKYPSVYEDVGRPSYFTNTYGFISKLRSSYGDVMSRPDYRYVQWIAFLGPTAVALVLMTAIFAIRAG